MNNLGRNDICHCGSGKKYKKCCLEKDKKQAAEMRLEKAVPSPQRKSIFMDWLSYEEVNALTTEEIIRELEKINIPFQKEVFLQDLDHFYSAQDLSEEWFNRYKVSATGRMEDFPFFAAWILWERLAPSEKLSAEQMEDLLEDGFRLINEGNSVAGCKLWLKAWEGIKYRYDKHNKNINTLSFLSKSFSVSNFCQDLETELHNAGTENPVFFEKRIDFCSEFGELFPEEEESTLLDMRRAIAASYSELGRYTEAEAEFEQIVQDFPNNPWGYIGWGDMYFMDKKQDAEQAKSLYVKALNLAKDKFDKDIINERIRSVEQGV